MSAATMPASWAGLGDLRSPLAAAPSPIPTTTPTLKQWGDRNSNSTNRIERIKQIEKDDPVTLQLYEIHVARHLASNKTLPQIVSYLFGAVSGLVAERLMGLAIDLNPEMCEGTKEECLSRLKEQWGKLLSEYPRGLPLEEREIFLALDENEQATFRIMRDLALQGDGQFYMSCDELERRGAAKHGWYMRNKFAGTYRIIETVKLGVRREKGVRGIAGFYRWVFPLRTSAS